MVHCRQREVSCQGPDRLARAAQDTAARPSLSAQYHGWDASRSRLLDSLQAHKPVDGILGAHAARSPVQRLPARATRTGARRPTRPPRRRHRAAAPVG